MEQKAKRFLSLFLCVAMVGLMLWVSHEASAYGDRFLGKGRQWRIVIDAGHGGEDPGKVGADGTKESDINLAIAQKLEKLFLAEGANVVMTRREETSTYKSREGFHKKKDMEERVKVINEHGADVLISIHQNSYTDEAVCGPQVFYYGESKEGEKLAKKIQASVIRRIEPSKKREAKAENSYYLLKESNAISVIVECGFLSNQQELSLLKAQEYQEKMAWAIYMGTMNYLQSDAG